MVNSLDYTLVLQDYPEGYILSDFYKLPRDLSPSRMFVKFCFKLLYSNRCGKNFQIYGVHIPRKCIDLMHFYSSPSPPHLKLASKFLSSHPINRRKLHIPSGCILSKIWFPERKGWRKLICFIKIQSENIKMTCNIKFLTFYMICYFFKCDGFTVL